MILSGSARQVKGLASLVLCCSMKRVSLHFRAVAKAQRQSRKHRRPNSNGIYNCWQVKLLSEIRFTTTQGKDRSL